MSDKLLIFTNADQEVETMSHDEAVAELLMLRAAFGGEHDGFAAVLLTEAEREAVEELKASLGLTMSGVFRQALRTYQLVAKGHSKLVDVEPDTRLGPTPSTPDDFGDELERLLHTGGYVHPMTAIENADKVRDIFSHLQARAEKMEAALNTPELHDFAAGVVHEAAHQRERWGVDHDIGKEPEDWFWLVGFLTGKALRAARDGDTDKALHHTISTAATLANWHASLSGTDTRMQPGHAPSVARAALETKADD